MTGGYNSPGQYSQSGQYWSIEILSGQLNIFSSQSEIMALEVLVSLLEADHLIELQVQMLFLQVAS